MKKVAIGIPTFNRIELVRLNAQSLRLSNLGDVESIFVVDDKSSSFGGDFLSSVYPEISNIIIRTQTSGGADFAAYDTLKILADSKCEILILLDSDFIVRSDFVDIAMSSIRDFDGIVTLFNTESHQYTSNTGGLLIKDAVGAAGTVWKREMAVEVINNVSRGTDWDWRFCDYLKRTGRKIGSVPQSAVQHIGFYLGQNTTASNGNIGVGFYDSQTSNESLLIEALFLAIQSSSFQSEQYAEHRIQIILKEILHINTQLSLGPLRFAPNLILLFLARCCSSIGRALDADFLCNVSNKLFDYLKLKDYFLK